MIMVGEHTRHADDTIALAAMAHGPAPRVEAILGTLVALGHTRRTDAGYASA